MFLQYVTNQQGGVDHQHAQELFQYHPLLITSLVETTWRNHAPSELQFAAWPQPMTDRIADDFFGVQHAARRRLHVPAGRHWDHLIYAFLVENTRIYDIFAKVLETYRSGEKLGRPSARSQGFWRAAEDLIFSNPAPTTVWNVTSRARPDEVSQRMTTYFWALGLELAHAGDIAQAHPYEKPVGANTEFIRTFEEFAKMVWRGIVNARNTSGENDTDNQAIASAAERMHDMFATRRQHGNLAREEFRHVAVMSMLDLAVSFDSSVVIDLGANASSPEQRLFNIAEKVGMTAHPKSKALFDLARPFSRLLRWVETGVFDDIPGAELLYRDPHIREVAEAVIGQYSMAMEQDMKAAPVTITKPAPHPQRLPAPRPLIAASR